MRTKGLRIAGYRGDWGIGFGHRGIQISDSVCLVSVRLYQDFQDLDLEVGSKQSMNSNLFDPSANIQM